MLFNPKNKKKIQIIWGVLVVLVIASMILLYLPSIFR
jgi:competence protein ComGC